MTQDEIIRFAIQCRLVTTGNRDGLYMDALTEFARLVAAKEREACAVLTDARLEKWASLFGKDKMYKWMLGLPKAIRARGKQA